MCEQAEAQAREQADAPVIIVMSGGWHQGVIGIVAGRMKERFGRPAIVIAEMRGRYRQGLGPVDLAASTSARRCSRRRRAGC